MAGENLIIDPTSEDAANVQLDISDSTKFRLMEHAYPTPARKSVWAGSIDTEGQLPASEHGYENREITAKVRVVGSSAADLLTQLGYLEQKVGKINRREGGTLKRTPPSGDVVVFDLLEAEANIEMAQRFISRNSTEVEIKFTAKPFGRLVSSTYSDHVETTLPHLVFTETAPKGDVPALGKLVVDDDSANDQWFLVWGIQSRYYDAASSAALFYEAESRTVQGGATAVAGPSGASGGGSNVVRQATLTPAFQSQLSTQASGGGAHLSNVGSFHVWARYQMPTTNTGSVSVAFEWAEGDFRKRTTNDVVSFAADHNREGAWVLVDLGQVHLTKVAQGTQRWEGRFLAKSTVVGDDIDLDCFWLFPVDEGYAELRAKQQFENPTAFSGRDEFDQTAGALAGKTLPVGGTWAGAGDADDFSVETAGKTAQRTATSDADLNTGRYAIAGATNFTNVIVQTDLKSSAFKADQRMGALARYTDTSNYLFAGLYATGSGSALTFSLVVLKRVAGTVSTLASRTLGTGPGAIATASFYSVRLLADAGGRYRAWFWLPGADPGQALSGVDADLATGGTLATGKPGIYDAYTAASAQTRNFDSFSYFVPTQDAVVFASQSVELRHDRVIREDSSGSFWNSITPEGDHLLIPPAGREARSARMLVKLSRDDPDWGTDRAIDDLSGRLTVTPRVLVVSEP